MQGAQMTGREASMEVLQLQTQPPVATCGTHLDKTIAILTKQLVQPLDVSSTTPLTMTLQLPWLACQHPEPL